jgi:thiosulfate dehydrogenase [quinone] large subunit
MNMSFLMAGTVSTNPVLFLAGILLILAWKNAGYLGLDRFLLSALGTPWARPTLDVPTVQTPAITPVT